MNILKKLFFILSVSTIPMVCISANINDVYVQTDKKMVGFSDAVLRANGSITYTGQLSKYLIDVNGRKAIVDFSSEKNIVTEMGAFYPDHIVIQIIFLRVKPNTTAYIDNSPIPKIDKHGNSITPKFPISEQGKHTVELKGFQDTVDLAILDIPSSSMVQCTGRGKMKCKVEKVY